MKFKFKNKNKGLTFVEVIIYLAVFSILFIGIMAFAIRVNDFNTAAAIRRDLQKNATFISQHIEQNFLSANAIDLANTTLTSNNGKMRLTNSSGGYVEYYLNSSAMKMTNNAAQVFDINDPMVNVTQFYLERVNNETGSAVGIKITLTLTSKINSSIDMSVNTLFTI